MDHKRHLYFEAGAEEVWLCGMNGTCRFFLRNSPAKPVNSSASARRCPRPSAPDSPPARRPRENRTFPNPSPPTHRFRTPTDALPSGCITSIPTAAPRMTELLLRTRPPHRMRGHRPCPRCSTKPPSANARPSMTCSTPAWSMRNPTCANSPMPSAWSGWTAFRWRKCRCRCAKPAARGSPCAIACCRSPSSGEGDHKRLKLATFDPFNLVARQAAAQELALPDRLVHGLPQAPPRSAPPPLRRRRGHLRADPRRPRFRLRPPRSGEDEANVIDQDDDEEASVVKFVNQIIREALDQRATDIHVEPLEHQPAHPLPDRRPPDRDRRAGKHQGAAKLRHRPSENHGPPRHRRAPRAAGRPDQPPVRRRDHRRPRRHRAHRRGRKRLPASAQPGEIQHRQARHGAVRAQEDRVTARTCPTASS